MHYCGAVPMQGRLQLAMLEEVRAPEPPIRLSAIFFEPGSAEQVAGEGVPQQVRMHALEQALALGQQAHVHRGDVVKGFAESDHVLEQTYRVPMVHQGYLEPHSATAEWSIFVNPLPDAVNFPSNPLLVKFSSGFTCRKLFTFHTHPSNNSLWITGCGLCSIATNPCR